jgi:hypothetical protein
LYRERLLEPFAGAQAEIGDCPDRDSAQIQNRCDPYSPTLGRLFRAREPG